MTLDTSSSSVSAEDRFVHVGARSGDDWLRLFAEESTPIGFAVTISGANVSTALTGFPVYINLVDMPDAFWGKVSVGGGDIRCYSETTELPREVVSCDPLTKTGELHVKADLSATADTVLLVTVDGVSADYAVTDPYGSQAVWSDYAAVWHLSQETGAYLDSTAGGFNSTSVQVTSRDGEGKLGGGTLVSAETDRVQFGDVLDMGTGDMSISAWVKTTDSKSVAVLAGKSAGQVPGSYALYLGNGGIVALLLVYGSDPAQRFFLSTPNKVNDDKWHMLHATWDRDTAASLYTDGALKISTAVITAATGIDLNSTNEFDISGYADTLSYQGLVDEVRVRRTVPSAARIAAEYANQNNPAGFYTITRAAWVMP